MKKNYIFIICLFLLSVSCSKVERYDDAELFDFDTFVKIEELKGRMLEFDSMIMRPNGIRVYDSLLVLIEPRSEKLVHVFNLNTRKKIGSALSFGQGPDDMLQPKLMTNGSHTFQLFDRSSSRIFEYDMATFLESQNPKPMRRLKLSVPVFISAEQRGSRSWETEPGLLGRRSAAASENGRKRKGRRGFCRRPGTRAPRRFGRVLFLKKYLNKVH